MKDYNKFNVYELKFNSAEKICMKEYVLIETLLRDKLFIDDKILIGFNYEQNELINVILKKLKIKTEAEEEWNEMKMKEFEKELRKE